MKKYLLGTVALVAFAAPAAAADMAARPYAKAPPPMIAAMYDWSGFYVGANGGWGSGRKCWDVNNNAGAIVAPALGEGCHDASGGVVARSAIAGRPAPGSSAWKRRETGLT